MAQAGLSDVERIKAASRGLRGTLVESLADPVTGALADDDQQLLKFHGSYQQYDRESAEARRQARLEPAYSFMIRARLPGGICKPAQWLALDGLSETYANGTLRLTSRQSFQLHGVLKSDLKATIAGINATLLDTISACGDVNRNVMSGPGPATSPLHAEVQRRALELSEHLLPRTRAYHEIWLDGEKLATGQEEEPILGRNFLPRKFKVALAVPPVNDVDVFTQDLGFIAIAEGGRLAGFNLVAGGGMGSTHGDVRTFARLGDVIGFFAPDRLLAVAEAVVTTQRDFGDRQDRKHARLKYTIADRGVDWFRAEVERRLGFALDPPHAFEFTTTGDEFGWARDIEDRWHLTLRIESGRVADRGDARLRSGLARIAQIHRGHFRLTPNQNLTIADVAAQDRAQIDALVGEFGLDLHRRARPIQLESLACVALPTCPLAMADAERYLPPATAVIAALLERHGLDTEPLLFRISGCPNGCSRPQLAEIALVGKAPGRYNLHLGGGRDGRRLSRLHLENLDEADILAALDPLFAAWAVERQSGEAFGDFLHRSGRLAQSSGSASDSGTLA